MSAAVLTPAFLQAHSSQTVCFKIVTVSLAEWHFFFLTKPEVQGAGDAFMGGFIEAVWQRLHVLC